MQIIMGQADIEEAIEKLVLDQVEVPEDMRIDIDLKATRGREGYTAIIDIVPCNAPEDDRSVDPRIQVIPGSEGLGIADKVLEAKAKAALPRRRGRPPGARNKPKTHREDAEVETQNTNPESEPDIQSDTEAEISDQEQIIENDEAEAGEGPVVIEEEPHYNEPLNELKVEEEVQEKPDEPEPEEIIEAPVEPKPTRSLFSNLKS